MVIRVLLFYLNNISERVLYTFVIVILYSCLREIPAPTKFGNLDIINGENVSAVFETNNLIGRGISNFIGGTVIVQSIFAAIPSLSNIKHSPGGYIILQTYTKIIALVISTIVPIVSGVYSKQITQDIITNTLCGIFGTCFIMWSSGLLNHKGLVNGLSVFIVLGILKQTFYKILISKNIKLDFVITVAMFIIISIFSQIKSRILVFVHKYGYRSENNQSSPFSNLIDKRKSWSISMRINANGVTGMMYSFYTLETLKVFAKKVGCLEMINWDILSIFLSFYFGIVACIFMNNMLEVAKGLQRTSCMIIGVAPLEETERFIQKKQVRNTCLSILLMYILHISTVYIAHLFNYSMIATVFEIVIITETLHEMAEHLIGVLNLEYNRVIYGTKKTLDIKSL